MNQYLVDKNILDECLVWSEHETNLRKLWKKYEPYYFFSRLTDLERKDLDKNWTQNVDFPSYRKDIFEKELKLSIIFLMNQISTKYSERVKEFAPDMTLDNPNISDDILVDFTVLDYSTDNNIVFEVYTVRRLMLKA